MSTMLRSFRVAVLCLGLALGLGGPAAAAEPVTVLPTMVAKSADAELWPSSPWIARRSELTVAIHRRADGAVVVGDLAGIEVYPEFAMLYRRAAAASEGGDDDMLIGAMARDGRMLFPIEDQIIAYFEVCQCFLRAGKEGVRMFDLQGQPRTDLVFDDVRIRHRTTDRLWPVVRNDRYGVLDARTAQLVLPMEYDRARVQGDLILARDQEDQWHAFDAQGRPIAGLGTVDDLVYWADAGLLIVDDQKLVARDGKVVVPAGRYTDIKPAGKYAIVARNRKYGLIDQRGKELVAPKYSAIAPADEGADTGRFLVGLDGFQGGRYGMVDGTGRVLLPPIFEDVEHATADYETDPTTGGAKRFAYLKVSRNDKQGVYGLDGKELLKPVYDALHTHVPASPWMLVIEKQRRGLYNVAQRKFTIPLGRFDDLLPFEDFGQGDELYRFQRNGRYGVVDRNGRQIVAADYELLTATEPDAPILAGVRANALEGIAVERDAKGVWRALPERRPVVTEPGYDGHRIAALLKSRIDTRYLPEGYETPEQITAAFADGRLVDANPPSIQVSGETAFVGFDNFKARSRDDALPNTMAMCFEDEGFRLLTKEALDGRRPDGSHACDDARAPALHFKADGDGRLECVECERHGLPTVWKRQTDAVACTLGPWQPDTAAARWRDWQAAMQSAWKSLPAVSDETDPYTARDTLQAALADVVEPESRMANALAALRAGNPPWAQVPAQMRNVDPDLLARTVLDLLWRAQPAGDGGRYPEADSELPQCARVWYLKLEDIEAALRAHAGDPEPLWGGQYQLPPSGELVRNAYAFVTMTETEDGLRLAGISRELVELAAWYLSVQPAARQ